MLQNTTAGHSELPPGGDARVQGLQALLVPIALFLGATLLFSSNLDRLPFPDELYHVLAAHGLVETGEPRIADGLYWRGYVQTWLTAWSFRFFGESLASARIPSILFTAGLVTALFLWLRAQVGSSIALAGAAFFALSPFTIPIAQFCRFYALQGLLFFAGAVLVFETVAPSRSVWARLGAGGLAVGLLAFALHLQPATTIGIIGLLLYVAGELSFRYLFSAERTSTFRTSFLIALAVAAATLLVVGWSTGLLAAAIARFRYVETFNAHLAHQIWFYHAWYQLLFPSLWPATGLLALAAFTRWPRPTGLALTVFATAFVLHSLAAAKNLRYVAYAHPFLIVLWTLGLASLSPKLREGLSRLVADLVPNLPLPVGTRRPLARLLAAGAVGFLILANPAWVRSITLLADIPVPPERPAVDWPAAKPVLAPYLANARIVVTSEELGTLYFLGRFDLTLNASRYDEVARGSAPTIVRDSRTGRGVGRGLEAMKLVLACRAPGLFISLEQFWNDAPQIIDPAVKAFLLEHARPLELPAGSGLVALTWEQTSGEAVGCGDLEPVARHRGD